MFCFLTTLSRASWWTDLLEITHPSGSTLSTTSATISGRVLFSGAPLSGVTIHGDALSWGSRTSSSTSSDGTYSISLPIPYAEVDRNWRVWGAKAGYILSPTNTYYYGLTSAKTLNFTASLAPTSFAVTVSGRVSDRGVGLPDIGIHFLGTTTNATITDPNGLYEQVLTNSWSGSVYIDAPEGYTPAPTNYVLSELSSPTNLNFNLGGLWLSGRILVQATGYGAGGISVAYDGDTSNALATTDSTGYFAAAMPFGWSGTVRPSHAAGMFTPVSIVVTSASDSSNFPSFYWLVIRPRVAGRVTQYPGGSGVRGVRIAFSDGVSAYSGDTGYYSRDLSPGFTGTATAHGGSYSFHPASYTYTSLVRSVFSQDYELLPTGQTWADPYAFLTNRISESPLFRTRVAASACRLLTNGLVVCASTNLQTTLGLVDTEVYRLAQYAYLQALVQDSFDTRGAMDIAAGIMLPTGNPMAYSYADVVERQFVDRVLSDVGVVSRAWAYDVAPSYLASVAGVYNISASVAGSLVLSDGTNSMFSTSLQVLATTAERPDEVVWKLSFSPTNYVDMSAGSVTTNAYTCFGGSTNLAGRTVAIPPTSISASAYLDAGTRVYVCFSAIPSVTNATQGVLVSGYGTEVIRCKPLPVRRSKVLE